MSYRRLTVLVGVAVAIAGWVAPGFGQVVERVSLGSAWQQGNGDSSRPAVSADGRVVAFYSDADNLVPGDTNTFRDVFVRDRLTGTTVRASLTSAGGPANGPSSEPVISANGRYVAFWSDANNLVPGDTNAQRDIFVRDLVAGTTTRVSVASNGAQSNGPSDHPVFSDDGRYVAFDSAATNLVAGDTNGFLDVFTHDLVTGVTTRVSVSSAGVQGNHDSSRPSLSADGRYVAFKSRAANLVTGDTNVFSDIFVRDTVAGVTTRVSVRSNGEEADEDSDHPSISDDGRFVAFTSLAGSIVPGDFNDFLDIFVHDRTAATTIRVSVSSAGDQSDGDSDYPSISADGRFIAFRSVATNLVPADTNLAMDIFLHDRITATTSRMSVNSAGFEANAECDRPDITGDARFVAFRTAADNLVGGDTNGVKDVFLSEIGGWSLWSCQGVDGEFVLYVNGQLGYLDGYKVAVPAAGPFQFSMLLPSGGGRGKFLVHLNPGAPDASTVTPLPSGLGNICFPVLLPPAGTANPVCVWNNIGKTAKVGATNYFGTPMPNPLKAPVDFLLLPTGDPAHFPVGTRWTLQGVIHNPNASSPKQHSVTNAVVFDVVP